MKQTNVRFVVAGVAFFTLAMIPAITVFAQDINQQTSMSNAVMNKVIHHRLVGMLAEASTRKKSRDQKRQALDAAVGGGQGCGVDIGNVGSTGVAGQADQEIVIVGDVINVCN